ncbi:EAL domain-containing protein [Savagea faecisuis]|uniref:EAL domain-containing protein n=1 Tax=Savagea faecisuis TaxID=1274803 RepID=A0ABW3GSQ6_9BACL
MKETTKSELYFSCLMDSLDEYVMVVKTDAEGFITYTNQNFLQVSEWTPKRVLGKSIWQMFDPSEEDQQNVDLIWKTVQANRNYFGQVKKMSRKGKSYYVKMLATPIFEEDRLHEVLFLQLDVTEDMELQEKLERIAFIDFETGLMSRYKLEMLTTDRIKENLHFSFVHLNLDYYIFDDQDNKAKLDLQIIQQFANRLQRFFQDSPIARINKYEFVILTPHADWFIQSFMNFLEQQPIHIEHSQIKLTVSGGIAKFPEDQQTYERLLLAAREATQSIIRSGGGDILSLTTEQHKKIDRHALINERLPLAIQNGELSVVYQPQLNLKTGERNVYEALIRWNDEVLGEVKPYELIPISEESGLIHEIGDFLFRTVAQFAAERIKEEPNFQVAINSSIREFMKDNHSVTLQSILNEYDCPANAIQIEITEKFAFQAEEQQSITRQMQQLQQLGITFALDDFGTGYASFRFLQTLPISIVKIDKSYIQSLVTHPQTTKLVEGLIRLCHSLDIHVVAEGVEQEGQFKMLKNLGIDAVQGYYIAQPEAF